ncbi:MAG TPA: asparaginase [Streptosporangiaceae bacterium]|nr:asparaginase [Streptosporangiaceae bacterium]
MIRSGFAESRHRGSVVVLGPDGRAVLRAGETTAAAFPRSANKPMQAVGMLRAGLDLEGKLLALAAASHSGEAFHVAGVREILAGAGLDEAALRCPSALPLDERALRQVLREGGDADQVHMNCSGKHAAMLATCAAAGWPPGSYLDPDHPLQREIRRTVEQLSGEPAAAVGVDGCGAPLFALSLTGLARAYAAMVCAEPGSPPRRVADAMRAYPDWASGTNRPERALMEAVPGLLLKSGAEGVVAFALPDGSAAAVKIEDGAARALPAVTVALLRSLSVGAAAGADDAALDRIASVPVLGGGHAVGHIRPVLPADPGPPPS